ncbi:MAG: amidophosphoribosyltransferase [Halobacteriovoraceae bacterium]|nr:amidophosphoribosyltransferase [Halobacteriovoraceae bacterium]
MCGIVGIIGTPHSSQETYQGLLLLQHRGQDAAGILSFDFEQRRYTLHKNQGLVDAVFDSQSLKHLSGEMSIGHTRYSTVGVLDIKDVQPLTLNYPFGLGLVHNGNLVNFDELQKFLEQEKKRYIFTKNDGEILINLLSDHLAHVMKKQGRLDGEVTIDFLAQAVEYLFKYSKGGYSVLTTIAPYGLLAFRDPHGIRPLVLGKRKLTENERKHSNFEYSYCLCSETVVLNFLGYQKVRDLEAGELLFIDQKGNLHSRVVAQKSRKTCMFEWVYFANPESEIEDQSVYRARLNLGEALGKKIKKMIKNGDINPDVVVPVPETSRIAASKMSEVIDVPLRQLLNKNRYVQRSFILNNQDSRERAVKLKLFPIDSEIKGKNILVVDDSIVRGTTSARIVKMLKDSGANEIYFASTCPQITHPCGYGIDFPRSSELIAYNKSDKEIEQSLDCQKVIYLDLKDLEENLGNNICMGCLTGNYPTGTQYIEEKNNSYGESQLSRC